MVVVGWCVHRPCVEAVERGNQGTRETETLGRGHDSTALVGFDKHRILPWQSRLLAATRQHVATCHIPSTASSDEAEGDGAVLEDFLEEGEKWLADQH